MNPKDVMSPSFKGRPELDDLVKQMHELVRPWIMLSASKITQFGCDLDDIERLFVDMVGFIFGVHLTHFYVQCDHRNNTDMMLSEEKLVIHFELIGQKPDRKGYLEAYYIKYVCHSSGEMLVDGEMLTEELDKLKKEL